jgi:hypothetical protein
MRAPVVMLALAIAAPARADDRDPDLATCLSATAGVVGAGLMLGAHHDGTALTIGTVTLLVGPSAGHWYAGHVVTTGLGIRAAGLVTAGVGIDLLVGCDGEPGCSTTPGWSLVGAGFGVMVAGAVWDSVTARGAVRDWNQRHAVTLVPARLPSARGDALGLALVGRF